MISDKQEITSWDDANSLDTHSIDANEDWEKDMGFVLIDLPTSEFLTKADELEQTYGNVSCAANGWGFQPPSPKLQIRNHDCMWSGTCRDRSHPGGPKCRLTPQEHAKLASNSFNTVTAVAAASLNSNAAVTQKPVLTPSNNSAININNNITPKNSSSMLNKTPAAQIPAGRSLLINPRVKHHQQHISRVPTVSTVDFLRERESTIPLHTRPDTPLSLDDDPPEFKHNIDLATCTIGSNHLSLTGASSRQHHSYNHHDDASSHRIINMLKEQLEDTESGSIRTFMTSSSGEIGSLTDLLNDLEEMDGDIGEESHGEEMDYDSDGESHADSSSRSSKGGGGGTTSGDFTHDQEMSPSSTSPSSSSSHATYEYQGTHVGDHSYTRPKNRYNPNELGVQTPSDSEEEIDVVSIGEKNLPTNPTARDRRALQSRVAHKIARKQAQTSSSSGSSSSSGGAQRHHHHRRRHSDDDFRAGHSRSPQTPSPSKAAALSPNYPTPAPSASISGSNTPLPGSSSSSSSGSSRIPSNPRKRSMKDDHNDKNRHQSRNKKQRLVPSGKKMPSESPEEQDTLEKRNLHNDMERQRRIGLKNLFEELKLQIPSLRDKERAPKVNILREAALLCRRLTRENAIKEYLQNEQNFLYDRVRDLRGSLHNERLKKDETASAEDDD